MRRLVVGVTGHGTGRLLYRQGEGLVACGAWELVVTRSHDGPQNVMLTILGPIIVLAAILVAVSPIAAAVHFLMHLLRRTLGIVSAVAIYAVELAVLYYYVSRVMHRIDAGIQSGTYDGPVGYGEGMFGGFILIAACALAALNGFGLWRLFRKPRLPGPRKTISAPPT